MWGLLFPLFNFHFRVGLSLVPFSKFHFRVSIFRLQWPLLFNFQSKIPTRSGLSTIDLCRSLEGLASLQKSDASKIKANTPGRVTTKPVKFPPAQKRRSNMK